MQFTGGGTRGKETARCRIYLGRYKYERCLQMELPGI